MLQLAPSSITVERSQTVGFQSLEFATDDHFLIGQLHTNNGMPCQDYALSGTMSGAAYAIVTDGCSGGDKTDVGARLLALATAGVIKAHWITTAQVSGTTAQEIAMWQRVGMAGTQRMLDLSLMDMLATCAFAYISLQGGIIHLQGDGIVALKWRDGRITMYKYDWSKNTPYYPAYNLNDALERFVQEHGGDVHAFAMGCERWECDSGDEGGFEGPLCEEITLGDGIRGITISLSAEELQELEFVAVFSDGPTQVEGMDWKQVVVDLMAFKNTQGVFVKRRMNRMIKIATAKGAVPWDDQSMACIHLIPTKGGENDDDADSDG